MSRKLISSIPAPGNELRLSQRIDWQTAPNRNGDLFPRLSRDDIVSLFRIPEPHFVHTTPNMTFGGCATETPPLTLENLRTAFRAAEMVMVRNREDATALALEGFTFMTAGTDWASSERDRSVRGDWAHSMMIVPRAAEPRGQSVNMVMFDEEQDLSSAAFEFHYYARPSNRHGHVRVNTAILCHLTRS